MMLYVVYVNYTKFTFCDMTTAMSFADLARRYIDGENNEVSVEFVLETLTNEPEAES